MHKPIQPNLKELHRWELIQWHLGEAAVLIGKLGLTRLSLAITPLVDGAYAIAKHEYDYRQQRTGDRDG